MGIIWDRVLHWCQRLAITTGICVRWPMPLVHCAEIMVSASAKLSRHKPLLCKGFDLVSQSRVPIYHLNRFYHVETYFRLHTYHVSMITLLEASAFRFDIIHRATFSLVTVFLFDYHEYDAFINFISSTY